MAGSLASGMPFFLVSLREIGLVTHFLFMRVLLIVRSLTCGATDRISCRGRRVDLASRIKETHLPIVIGSEEAVNTCPTEIGRPGQPGPLNMRVALWAKKGPSPAS